MELGLLSRLSPAETYLLLNGKRSEFKQLLQLTLADLHLKEVIKITSLKGPSEGAIIVRIALGSKHQNYIPLTHEQHFIKVFKDDHELSFELKDYIKSIIYRVENKWKFISHGLIKNRYSKELYDVNLLYHLLRLPKLSPKGLMEKMACKPTIIELENQLFQLNKSNPNKAKELIKQLGGNIYLIKSMDHIKLKELFFHSPIDKGGTKDEYEFSESYLMPFFWFEDEIDDLGFGDGFDISFDNASTHSDDGADGCSSCSGCSGCGGCGGE